MWAQQERFQGNFTRFVEIASDAGFEAIEVSHSTDEAGLRECLSCSVLPVVSLHAPTPFLRDARGVANSARNLAATDEDERATAVVATRRTIEFAAEAGIRAVVVHLGAIGRTLFEAERRLRALYAEGQIDSDQAARVRDDGITHRAAVAPAHIAAARRSLAELMALAAPRGVAIGLENRLYFHEIPSPEEAAGLLAEYAPREAGYWHDVGHAEVWARLGLAPHTRWFELLGDRMIGSHLHDVRGIRDHRAPGNGTLDWTMVRGCIPPDAARTCEIDQHEPEHSLADAVAFLAAEGVIEPQRHKDTKKW
jgi:sugar phosphate isomerase/epimerase